jgi:hypothetical protein
MFATGDFAMFAVLIGVLCALILDRAVHGPWPASLGGRVIRGAALGFVALVVAFLLLLTWISLRWPA